MSTYDETSIARRQKLDRYEILAEIASGGMATVYVGRLASAGFERLVAIKRLHPHLEREREFIEMFLDEARIAARIHHPNVVATLEFGGNPERGHYLVMDYVEGTTLAKLLAKAASGGGRVPQPIALRIILDSLSGLHVAHDLTSEDGRPMEIVHRDVSPQNILVGMDGTARITDFGVARAAERLAVTRTGQLKGKLGYMAPEQAKGEHTDRRADIFAMGVILWESLAGRRLFRGKSDTDAETLSRLLYVDIPRLSDVLEDVHPALDTLVMTALQRPVNNRFATCADFIDAIEHASHEGLRIATSREVARYLDEVIGREVAQRREAIRTMSPAGALGVSTEDTLNTDVPRLVSSVSSAAMSVSEPLSQASINAQLPVPPPPSSRGQALLMGALAAALLVTVAAVGTMLWVVMRPPLSSSLAGSTPVPTTSALVADPSALAARENSPAPTASAESSATTEVATASAAASASAAPVVPVHRYWVPGPLPTAKQPKPKPANGDDLSSNPYRP